VSALFTSIIVSQVEVFHFVLLYRILVVTNLWKSLVSLNSIRLIEKFALIDDGVLQMIHKLNISEDINTLQSGNDFVLDLVLSESASLVNDRDYKFLA
jgi:hypothetical protein